MKLAIIRERKTPPDYRVPLIPAQCKALMNTYPSISIEVESYPGRCFSDEEYIQAGIPVSDSLPEADVYLGVKEVPVDNLVAGKTYFFFSHTIKKQPYNRNLLKTVLEKNIRLIDYECLEYANGPRIVGFGKFAGIVGAYNGLLGWGKRYGTFSLKPAHECFDLRELEEELAQVTLPPVKVLLTGAGKVGNGAKDILLQAGLREVEYKAYMEQSFPYPVFCQVEFPLYNKHRENKPFDNQEFYRYPERYESDFHKFLPITDIFIAGHFWSNKAPRFYSREDMLSPDFRISVIADISCDLDGPIPSTLRSSTIADPFYGYDPKTGTETAPFETGSITVMAVDNLPCELPRDASTEFGNLLSKDIIPLLVKGDDEKILANATIAENGRLTEKFLYLTDYVNGELVS